MAAHFDRIPIFDTVNMVLRAQALANSIDGMSIKQAAYQHTQLEEETHRIADQTLTFQQGNPRIGLLLESTNRLIKISIQDNRFHLAWTKQSGVPYPRYENVKKFFFESFDTFCKSIPGTTLSPIINQVGIQYVNIVDDDDRSAHENFNFADLSQIRQHEGWMFKSSQRLTEKKEVGRLHFDAITVFNFEQDAAGRVEEKRKLKFMLTFRGRPTITSVEGMSLFLDRGREAIVTTFSESLTKQGKEFFQEAERET